MTAMIEERGEDLSAQLIVERAGRDSEYLRALATLRMTVFRSWPYLYDGSEAYEARYLAEFLSDPSAALIVARLGEIPVGMATASPMASQSEAIRRPFLDLGLDPDRIFYFGESVLLPQFRGLGIGNRFFAEREAAARSAGADTATFCAVARPAEHPMRPAKARDLTDFWNRRGYRFAPRLTTTMDWKEVGHPAEQPHLMQFWIKQL